MIRGSTASDLPYRRARPGAAAEEVDTYAEIGLFDGQIPDITTILDDHVGEGLYDDNDQVIWPSSA